MSFGMGESPGSIRNQVGRSLNEIREAVSREDVLAMANHLRLLVALSSPHLASEKKLEIPPASSADDAQVFFEKCMGVLEELLLILAKKGIYARVSGAVGDATDLALEDEDAPVSVEVAP